jgi:predicted nucleotidyltransferase
MLSPAERSAAREFVARVRRLVRADLEQASLFGSKARGDARPDSDLDVLLVFRCLAWDREPHATHAEAIADAVARESGIPVTAWSVSLPDLEVGNRTPMLVDALADSVPLWCAGGRPLPVVCFTPHDALRCVRSLLDRIQEGSLEYRERLDGGCLPGAALRARDDLIRGCTAVLLTRGITRPRRGEVVASYRRIAHPAPLPAPVRKALDWAASSYGADGRDDRCLLETPPGSPESLARAVDLVRRHARADARRLARRLAGNLDGLSGYPLRE